MRTKGWKRNEMCKTGDRPTRHKGVGVTSLVSDEAWLKSDG